MRVQWPTIETVSIPQVVPNPNQVPVLPVGRSLLSSAALEWLVKPSTLPRQLANSHLQVPYWLAYHQLSDESIAGSNSPSYYCSRQKGTLLPIPCLLIQLTKQYYIGWILLCLVLCGFNLANTSSNISPKLPIALELPRALPVAFSIPHTFPPTSSSWWAAHLDVLCLEG